MWRRLTHLYPIILLIFFLYNSISQAQSLAFSRNARTFETVQSSLFIKGLSHACLAITQIPDGMPCNPANLPFIRKPKLSLEILLSNGHAALNNVQKLLKEDISDELVNSLFSEGQILQIEANSELNFQSKHFNARYTPLTVKGFSVVRNEADPNIEIAAIQEKGFLFQTGFQMLNDVYLGAQLRFIERKFVKQQFKLTLLGTDQGKTLLKPKTQSLAFFEPGVTWILAKQWEPRLSLLIANLGSISEKHDELNTPAEAQVAFGVSPPISWGELELSIEYKSLTYEESDLEKIRFGGFYQFGAMNLVGGVDANGISGGIFYGLNQVDAGILFSTTKVTNEDENFFTQTVYVQLGWRI